MVHPPPEDKLIGSAKIRVVDKVGLTRIINRVA